MICKYVPVLGEQCVCYCTITTHGYFFRLLLNQSHLYTAERCKSHTASGPSWPVGLHELRVVRFDIPSRNPLLSCNPVRCSHLSVPLQAELLAAQSQQYEATDALLMEMQFLREEIRRLQERY